MLEIGYNCTQGICEEICGDGLKVGNEECDDNNTKDGDGCSSKCKVETGYNCSHGVCTEICGDGIKIGKE